MDLDELKIDKNEYEIGIYSNVDHFLNAEKMYLCAAEFYATLVRQVGYNKLNFPGSVKQCEKFIDKAWKRECWNKALEIDDSLSSDVVRVRDELLNDPSLEYDDEILEFFVLNIQDMNTYIEFGLTNIKYIRKNLAEVDPDFGAEYDKKIKELLGDLAIKQGKNKIYLSKAMMNLLNYAIENNLFEGTDLDVIKTIRDNSDFEKNASLLEKYLKDVVVFGLSVIEGLLQPFEAVMDGAIFIAAGITDIFDGNEDTVSNAMLQFLAIDGCEYLYDEAVGGIGIPYLYSHGGLHSIGLVLGDCVGDVLIFSVSGGVGIAFNALKKAGEDSEKFLSTNIAKNPNYLSSTTSKERLDFYLSGVKSLAVGAGGKAAFKGAQKYLAESDEYLRIVANGNKLTNYLWLHTMQGATNAGIKYASNVLDRTIDLMAYGESDVELGNDLIKAYVQGFFAPNSNAKKYNDLDNYLTSKYEIEDIKKLENFLSTANVDMKVTDILKYTEKIMAAFSENSDDETLNKISEYLTVAKKWGLDAGKY